MRRAIGSALALLLLVTGCSSSSTSGSGQSGQQQQQQQAGPVSRDPQVMHYGAAPTPNSDVTYQPDVVIVGGGGTAVRSVTDGGLTWRLDSASRGAGELGVGKIMFVTGRGVGRVIHLEHDGGDTVATIVPVGITDVIKDGTFKGNTPISLDDTLVYQADQPFWGDGGATADAPAGAAPTPSNFTGRAFAPLADPSLPVPKHGGTGTVNISGFKITGECCANGAGVSFAYDSGDIRLQGKFFLTMSKPTATFNLAISGGKVTAAQLELGGGIGIRVEIAGATTVFRSVDKLIPIPLDFNVPFANILGVPLSATVNQLLGVHTFFSSKDGNIKATGEWALNGGLGFSYADGVFSAKAPSAVKIKTSILDTISGIATGVAGISVDYQTRVTVGIGAFGFTAGLFFFFAVHIYLVRGSALGSPIAVCNIAQLQFNASYGVGYSIPKAVAKLVNFFLEKFGSKPIEAQGGIGKDVSPFNKTAYDPDSDFCRKK